MIRTLFIHRPSFSKSMSIFGLKDKVFFKGQVLSFLYHAMLSESTVNLKSLSHLIIAGVILKHVRLTQKENPSSLLPSPTRLIH